VSYGAFIVPGLIMLTVFTESLNNAAFGIHMPKFTGTIYELLSAPVSPLETVLAYVGAAATKSVLLGLVILGTASLFMPFSCFIRCGCSATWCWWRWPSAWPVSSSGSGRKGFEELQFVPMLVSRR
jgi:ABC-2 type transport system permease protein